MTQDHGAGSRRQRRRARGTAWFEERLKTEEEEKAGRIARAILIARLRRLEGLPLDAIEDAIGKELERTGFPPRLGRFFVEIRISELQASGVWIDGGSWTPAEPSAAPPAGYVEARHPALQMQRRERSLAELLVLVEEVRARIEAGNAAGAAIATWKLHDRVTAFGAQLAAEDRARGRAIRLAGHEGRSSPERKNSEQAERHNLWKALNAELRRSRPRLGPTARATEIAKATGGKSDTIRRYLRLHDPDERQKEKWEVREALPKNIG